jgi:hypothetical protein
VNEALGGFGEEGRGELLVLRHVFVVYFLISNMVRFSVESVFADHKITCRSNPILSVQGFRLRRGILRLQVESFHWHRWKER